MGNLSEKEEKSGLPFFERDEPNSYKQLKGDISKSCKCSYKTRLIGYAVCAVIGWLLAILSSIIFFIKHDVVIFAVLYSAGQIINISGSCFLSGPKTQAKDMCKSKRIVLTILYLGSMVATIVLAFVLPENLKALILIPLVMQMVSYFFYTLSFIPFGNKILKKCCECLILD